MAGTVAKQVVYNQLSDGSYLKSQAQSQRVYRIIMEQDVVLEQLNDQSFNRRAEVLDELRTLVRRNGGRLPFAAPKEIFTGLSLALCDSNWDVRHQCIQLINELIPQFGQDLDMCMAVVLPTLIPNLGDSKITIRRAVIQTIHVYMKYTADIQHLFKVLVKYGLDSKDQKVKRETTIALPMLFTPEFSQENFYDVAYSLIKKLCESSPTEDNSQQSALISLNKLKNLVGDDEFNTYIQKLPTPLRKYYNDLSKVEVDEAYALEEATTRTPTYSAGNQSNVRSKQTSRQEPTSPRKYKLASTHADQSLEFGFIPSHVMACLTDQTDFRNRSKAVEELKHILGDLDDIGCLLPHVLAFVSFLNNLLDDNNFKITTATLDILSILVERGELNLKPHVRPLVSMLTKRLGDNKIVWRQTIMKVFQQMMQIMSPMVVISVIADNLVHRNSRVRQETVNIVISALLTFPSYDFDMGQMCKIVAPSLIDSKRNVRQAVLECFGVLAQAMGAGRLAPLVQAVDNVELNYEGDGVMAAVQARLARRQLPRLNSNGFVEYATQMPSSASHRGAPGLTTGADIEWMMKGSGGLGSARSQRSDMELESVTSSARSTPGPLESPQGPSPRRFLSAGKSKLPWEDEIEERLLQNGNHPNSAPANQFRQGRSDIPPLQPRSTWADENDPDNQQGGKKLSKRNTFSHSGSRDQSPDSGSSYKAMYLKRKGTDSLKTYTVGRGGSLELEGNGLPSSSDGRENRAPYSKGQASQGKKKLHSSDDSEEYGRGYVPSFGGKEDPRMSLSNSWPHDSNGRFADAAKPRLLDPISAPETPSDWQDGNDERRGLPLESPIHMKPTLARGSSSKRKVPPIPVSDRGPTTREDDRGNYSDVTSPRDGYYSKDSARDSAYMPGSMDETDGKDEMLTSLRQIRNSATKKKAEKIFERLEKKSKSGFLDQASDSPSPEGDDDDSLLGESGVFSAYSTLSPKDDQDDPWETNKKGRKTESPFDTKPKLARKNSSKQLIKKDGEDGSSHHIDYNPQGGITFRDNKTSDVRIVGKGYAEDSSPSEPRPSQNFSKARERRRVQKGSLLSPLGMASVYTHGAVDQDDDKIPNIIGKGMFDANGAEHAQGKRLHKQDSYDRLDQAEEPPSGVFGKSMKQNNSDRQTGDIGSSPERGSEPDNSDEEPGNIALSKAMQERMMKKQAEMELKKQEEKEKRQREEEEEIEEEKRIQAAERKERDRLKKEKERERREKEKERREREKARKDEERRNREQEKERLQSLGDTPEGDLSISGNSSSQPATPPKTLLGKPPVATPPRRKTKSPSDLLTTYPPAVERKSSGVSSSSQLSSSLKSPVEMSPEELRPYNNPDTAVKEAQRCLAQQDWNTKCDGLTSLRRITLHHPEALCSQLHAITISVIAEVKNLRSQVSRLAIVCLGEMFTSLKKAMDADLEMTAKVLLAKHGDSNGFIRDDVYKALLAMADSVTPQRCLIAITAGGVGHRNVAVRKVASYFVARIVERMGPGRCLSGVKDITDKVLPAAAQFIKDGSPETRYNGRHIIHMLMTHQDFEKMITKHLQANALRNVQETVKTLQTKGLGEMPNDTPSARVRRSGQGSRSNSASRGSSAGSSVSDSIASNASSSARKRSGVRLDEQTQEEIKTMCVLMAASDWRDRYKGITTLVEMTEANPAVIGENIVKVFDKLGPRLQDSNSKVNVYALQKLLQLIPHLAGYLGSVINMSIQNIVPNLSSKNKEIHSSAMEVLESFIEHLDGSLLLQPFAIQAQHGNARIKPDMIEKVAYLVPIVYARKQKQVVLHVLPLLWHLLGASTGSGAAIHGGGSNIRRATTQLAHSLHSQMGQSLMDQAGSHMSVTPRHLQILQDMLDSSL